MDTTLRMKKVVIGWLCLASTLCMAQNVRQQPIAPQGGTEQQTRPIMDAGWNMVAATVVMPKGWKFDGVASHGDTCVSTLPDVRFAAESPDGSLEVQRYPQIRYSYSSDPQQNQKSQREGCLVTPHFKPEDFLTYVVAPALHPGAHFTVHPIPDNASTVQERAKAQQTDMQLSRDGTVSHSEITRLLIGFEMMHGGMPVLEGFLGQFRCTQTNFSATHLQTVECFLDNGTTLRAPASQMSSLINTSLLFPVLTDQWMARGKQLLDQRFAQQSAQMQTMFRNDQNALISQHKMLMDTQNAQFDAGQKRAANAESLRHAGDVASSNHIGDANDYTDPSTGKSYKVSNQYSHTYLDSAGKTILQTNSAYAPGPETVWQELQPHQ